MEELLFLDSSQEWLLPVYDRKNKCYTNVFAQTEILGFQYDTNFDLLLRHVQNCDLIRLSFWGVLVGANCALKDL